LKRHQRALFLKTKSSHSYITKELHNPVDRVTGEDYQAGQQWLEAEKETPMHDFLIALTFIAMVASPALIVAAPRPVSISRSSFASRLHKRQ
jgi:hypothetical protein